MNLDIVWGYFITQSKTWISWLWNNVIRLMLVIKEPFQDGEQIMTERLVLFYFLVLFVQVSLESRKYKDVWNMLSFFLHQVNCNSIFIRKYSLKLFNKRKKILPNKSSALYFAYNKINNLIINNPALFCFCVTSRLKFLFDSIFVRLSVLFVVKTSLKILFFHWSKRLIDRDIVF